MDVAIDPVAGIEWLAGLFPVRPPRGRPLTVMFTDIAGFTAYAAAHGDRAAARLVHLHDAAVLPAIRRHSGSTAASRAEARFHRFRMRVVHICSSTTWNFSR